MKKLIIALALATTAAPATAGTLIIDTGIGTGNPTRPVNGTTELLGQFVLTQNSIIDQIFAYGRVVTPGDAFFGIFNSVGGAPSPLTPILSQSATFAAMPQFGYYGISNLGFSLAAGTYFVGIGPTSGSTFTSTVLGGAPAGLGLEGAIKGAGAYYVPTNNVDLSWKITGTVPEPATWGMMMLGFGLIGGAMRSSRRKPKVSVSFA